jgi:hypothetical protein
VPRDKKRKSGQALRPFDIHVPKGHLVINIKITQENGAIDKKQALEILRSRPYTVGIIDKLIYRGATSKFHVFSYPDPAL